MAEQKNGGRKNKPDDHEEKEEKSDTPENKIKKEKKPRDPSSLGNQLFTILLAVIALFIGICYIFPDDVGLCRYIYEAFFGLFGGAAILIPFLVFNHALFHKRNVETGADRYRWCFSVLIVFSLSILVQSILSAAGVSFTDPYVAGQQLRGGGTIGSWCAGKGALAVGNVGVIIFSAIFLIIFALCLFGLTPAMFWEKVRFYILRCMERREADKHRVKEKKVRENKKKTGDSTNGSGSVSCVRTRRGEIDPDVFYGSDDLFDDSGNPVKADDKKTSETLYPVNASPEEEDGDDDYGLESIFNEPENSEVEKKFTSVQPSDEDNSDISSAQMEIKVERKPVAPRKPKSIAAPVIAVPVPPAPPAEPPKPVYVFPPVDLLNFREQSNGDGVEQELRSNAQKITQTLESFGIHTRVTGISRGPAVTRYEVTPEAGTKVNAIVNRADDISLGLASTVLINGVIPGKSAIGIEVPNKNKTIVYLRELIDSDEFRNAKGKLTCALGIDLTGTKIFFDLSRMPHLLIAGATNQGKSVCVNTLIVSLLYRATPDDVKFILIDPKKVEFSDYNGLPHLIVPVVNDPKKAAGSLHWCVTEMERRYEILEHARQKKISEYIEFQKEHPENEKLSYIVVIIDELADLMMTAPDDVEMSIARITAKGRAAGIHLIISTQRPSVDVVTGTIKSNIPSRIALKCSSQIDSRTILDRAGAEKLVGKGDLLFTSVDSLGTMRVQCALVDKEVESIVEFIKEHNGQEQYSDDVTEKINKEAELCGKKGRASEPDDDGGDEDGGDDPMLKQAIELAVDEKKISTSLIQRRLSLGYGRAAKLIDVMERRGIVSAPDGQKPRSVLITREQYYEMQMRDPGNENESENENEDKAPWVN